MFNLISVKFLFQFNSNKRISYIIVLFTNIPKNHFLLHFPTTPFSPTLKLKFTREESRSKILRFRERSNLDTIPGAQRFPFHPIGNEPMGLVQASLAAGRSHFNRGATVLTWKVQVYAVQVCVRGWPTCRGRAAHYSNPCVAVCARCPLPAYIISPRQSTMYTFPSAGSFHFRRVSAKYPRETRT